ncbi:NAD(P)-dependent oxidoreductase [Kocuria sp. CPCC 205258]|uniref:NAD(P)-dependent oxidoreductase n=1 Tax=Kocuria sp. CPCC 205258 TaxID=3073552 RepID=UPI0034D732B2
MMENIGLIGTGNAGYCYLKNLLKAGKTVHAYDATAERRALAEEAGARIADGVAGIAAAADVVVLSLPNPQAVRAVLLGDDGLLAHLSQGGLVIDISTIDRATATEVDEAARARGVQYLEAPMSGGEPGGAGTFGAEAATITFLCGGEQEAFDRAQEVFEILGSHNFLLGSVGKGNELKLISNLLAGVYAAVAAEAFVLGKAAGFSYETMFEVFARTDAKSFTMLEEFKPHLLDGDYSYGFPVELQHKDHRLAGEMARELNVPLFFNTLSMELYQTAMAHGLGRESHIAVVKQIADTANVKL